MNTLFHKTCLKALYAGSLAMMLSINAHAATLSLQNVPLYLLSKADPNVLFNMSVESPMGGAAYNDNTGIPAGCTGRLNNAAGDSNADDVGSCYFTSTTYLGYFDPNKCYTYSTTNSRFDPSSAAASDHSCSSKWSGNFLNWATMTAIDMFIWPMTGGNRITDTTSLTVVKRAQNSGNTSWFPRKVLTSSINVAPSTVTPYSDSTLFIHNTAWGFQLGTSFNQAIGSSPKYGPFNVNVQVCNSTVGVESNCVAYGSSSTYYKPEGLIQRNSLSKRFALTSYSLDNSQSRDGGILRSNMKYVGPTLPDGSANSAKEYGTDGLLINNPDGASSGLNSGVINYINKFSESGYKSYDPTSELFYEGIRYYKHLGPTPEYSSGLTTAQLGGFPALTTWNDPIQYRCQKNFVVAINDANPWLDKKLPGTFFTTATLNGNAAAGYGSFSLNAGDYGEPSNPDPDINVRTLTNTVGDLEGLNGTTWTNSGTWTSGTASGTNDSVGGGVGTFDDSCTSKLVAKLGEVMGTCPYPDKQNSYYIAGLAYYANITDLRTDFANDRGIQNVQSFVIDTQEYNTNQLDGNKNMLWLAGKYGGFNDKNGDGVPQTSEWDADGDGIPDNYVLATQPQNLIAGLNKAFDVIDNRTSSASAASVNSGSVSSTTRIYQARFETSGWTGQLLAYPIDTTTGALGTAVWDASTLLPAAASRKIITTNSTGTPIAFQWASLDSTRRTQLDSVAATAQSKLNYLRGDASNEGTGNGQFRVRTATKLGDIINSAPSYVAAPNFNYSDSLESAAYSAFVTAKKSRTPMIYVGANDGMLHGFNASSGTGAGAEVFGFIPDSVFQNLTNLTAQNYAHQYFVDGSPSVGDAFFSSAWHTVLVGGLNGGGQGIYALDVTDPSTLATAESNPSSVVLWQYTDTNDSDLGYTFSQPAIVRLNNGKWAAVFGNGYNNTAAPTGDTHVSSTGEAVLYIVDISNGSLIRKITTKTGTSADPTGAARPNGLATPVLVDLNGDQIADYAYAGDLFGNVWKFDLRGSTTSNWDSAFKDSSNNPLPLYQARDSSGNAQPITERLRVTRGPQGSGFMVLFGTGKYLEPSDKQISPRRDQSFYGILDANTGTATDRVTGGRGSLQQQTILAETSVDPDGSGPAPSVNVRVTSNNALNGKSGWYIDLVSPSLGYQNEKQITEAAIRNGHVIFTTLIPDADPCNFGGSSWLMELDALSGSRPSDPVFDVNHDGKVDGNDVVTVTLSDGTTVTVAPTAVKPGQGINATPVIIDDSDITQNKEYKYTTDTNGNIQVTVESPGKTSVGRQSWRQIK